MKTAMLLTAALGLALPASVHRPQVPASEPPMRLRFEIEGQAVSVTAGESFELALDGKKHKAKVLIEPTRIFRGLAFEFEYPLNMAFSTDFESEGLAYWSLDGGDTVIAIQLFSDGGLEELLAGTVEGLKSVYQSIEVSEISITLDGQEIEGRSVLGHIAGVALRQDLYAFEAGNEVFILSVQDSLTDDDEQTEETRGAYELLERSFHFIGD